MRRITFLNTYNKIDITQIEEFEIEIGKSLPQSFIDFLLIKFKKSICFFWNIATIIIFIRLVSSNRLFDT